MLKFKANAFFFHLAVALRVELIEECHFLVGHWERFVKLGQNTQFQHLVAEVAPVELHTEDSIVEVLQLGHGELLGQQFETYRLEMNLTAQFALRTLQGCLILFQESPWESPTSLERFNAAFNQKDIQSCAVEPLLCPVISSPCLSYCLRLPVGGSVNVILTTAVRSRLRSIAASKASIW